MTDAAKPKHGPCESCGAPGVRRKFGAAKYILCDEHARAMGAPPTLARRGRHRHGGKPGRIV